MKIATVLPFFLFIHHFIFSQPIVRNDVALDSIITLAKTTSVRRDSVNWQRLEPQLDSLHREAGIAEAGKRLLRELEDFHGRIWVNQVPYNGVIRPWKTSTMVFDSLILDQYQRTTVPILGQIIQTEYGYIRIPGLVMSSADSVHARQIRQTIQDIQQKHNPKGWIVDLRLNGGGTMYPMLAGLCDFYGDTKIGAFAEKTSGYNESWIIKDQNLYIAERQMTDYHLSKMGTNLSLDSLPVVVLISAATSSSGEITAISFKNRPRTRFIGEETAGYTTTVTWQPITENIVMQLTVSFYADRQGNMYEGTSVIPDEYIEGGDNFYDLEKDQKVLRAVEWLGAY
ncbi:MAG: S41 family peptidase [Bacteroidia bacterium]|nr:S41 family peptidase [Bacteroidia bacterium]